jgi:hypothetical protein
MATPFAGIIDQLRKAQPVPAKVILPDATGRLPTLGTLAATIRGRIAAGLPVGNATKVVVPFQGFKHTSGQSRAVHPTNQPPLAFQRGFRDLRRSVK